MAERLKRAAAWLGLVTDDRYADYDDAADFEDVTEDDSADDPLGTPDKPATVTPLESRRPVPVAASAVAMLTVAILTMLSAGLLIKVSAKLNTAGQTAAWQRALSVAESGMDQATVALN